MKNILWTIRIFCLATAILLFSGCSKSSKSSKSSNGNYTFRLPGGIKLEMVKIKAGSFMMDPQENGQQHQVTLTKDYWLGKYEVTNDQYEAVLQDHGYRSGYERHPIVDLSWNDAKEFCAKMNELFKDQLPPGYRFDLPTEAQWEYACRAGTTTALNNGKNLTSKTAACPNLDEVAWYFENSGWASNAVGFPPNTHPVGKKKPNAWGLFDMHGNASEWCLDGRNTGARTHRGGCYQDLAVTCTSSRWRCNDERYSDSRLGFRLALVPVQ